MLWMKWEKCLQSLWLSYVNDVICSRVMNDYKMPCLVSLIWVLKEEAKTIWVCWLYSWINLLCKKWNSRWELGLILWKWKPNKKRIDWRERQRNKAKRIEEEQRMDNDKEISLVCWYIIWIWESGYNSWLGTNRLSERTRHKNFGFE